MGRTEHLRPELLDYLEASTLAERGRYAAASRVLSRSAPTLTGMLDAERGEDVSFDPVVNTAPGLSLSPGWLANLRGSAYQRSRDGRDAD